MKAQVMLGVAAGTHFISQTVFALTDLIMYASDKYDLRGIKSFRGVMVDESRNRIVEEFLKTDAEWLFMFDTDVVFRADVIDKLLDMHKVMGTKVGSGWYNMQMSDGNVGSTIFTYSPDGTMSHRHVITEDSPPYFFADLGPSGAMLVHREVFEKMKASGLTHYFKYTHRDGSNVTFSEDVYFCNLVKEMGYKYSVCSDAYMLHHKIVAI